MGKWTDPNFTLHDCICKKTNKKQTKKKNKQTKIYKKYKRFVMFYFNILDHF